MENSKSAKAARDEHQKNQKFKHKFENRITIAKYGKASLDNGDYGNALKNFTEYLSIISEKKGAKERTQPV